ncbi:MAG: UxaA family hydrolase [Thermaerobacter sp.]|nr:UxaA family hydrolase [Thermaerobacter sp.]
MRGGLREFMGFPRADGRVGVRNHVLILPVSPAANRAALIAQQAVPAAAVVQVAQEIGPDVAGWELAVRVIAGWVDHPNVYAAVLVAVERDDPVVRRVMADMRGEVRCQTVTLAEAGGTRAAAEMIQVAVARWQRAAAQETRLPVPLSQLLLGTECGGSDACSGLSANPSLGWASDHLIAAGGTSILAETTELIGAEMLLATRARSQAVADRLLDTVRSAEHAAMRMGADFRGAQPAPGNMAGGLSTIEEKSLGCIHKGGRSSLSAVVEYAQRPPASGLVVMDTPGHDVMQLVGMVAGGAQVVVFTTGRGTPTGSAIAPVIKVSTRTELFRSLGRHIDLDAGPVIDGYLTVDQVGEQLLRKIVAVANGERVAAERLGHREFGIFQGWTDAGGVD